MKFKLNIQKKLVILLLVFALLPLAIIMPIVFEKLNTMEDERLGTLEARTKTIGEIIDRNLYER